MIKIFKKKLTKKNKIIIIISSVVLLFAIGITLFFLLNKEEVKIPKKKKQPKKEIIEKKLNIINEDSKSRPIAVMINNHKQARMNHAGLNDAYIVYEIVVEGGITRMMAIFKDKDTSRIGSVRSSRHYFLDYALENDAVYVHFGWSPQAQSDISSLGVNNINGLYDSAFWRDRSLGVDSEHTAFTSIEKINSIISSRGYRTVTNKDTLLNYSVDEIDLSKLDGAMIANNVIIPYSSYATTSYTYSTEDKMYYRTVNNVEHTSVNSSNIRERVSTKNIITYKVNNYSIDSYGRQNISNIGSGDGYYISNGYAVPIKWEKTSRSGETIYKYLNGNEIAVNDGRTFIQIQPSSQVLTIN